MEHTTPPRHQVDHLIVGGGTAGCVLAARLSHEPALEVLLVESGPDFPPGQEPAAIRDPFPTSYSDPRFSWPNLIAEVGADRGNGSARFSRQYLQGRGVGGSSSIMGMMATRGLPWDYDEWRDLGAEGWGWNDVLPFFQRCEHDLDFAGPLHGQTGPLPIRRNVRSTWPPFCRAFAAVLEERGHRFLPDYNAQFEDGVSAVPMNNLPHRRVSTSMAYLDAPTRKRANLHILPDATVETLAFDGRRAVGARVRTSDGLHNIRAREITLCAGALHTPAILMRSGIGPGDALHQLGVRIVADLKGVGRELQNHPFVGFAVDLRRHARQPESLRTWSFSVLRYSSNHAGCPRGDMQISPMNLTARHALGRRIGLLGISVYKPYSRGEVTLRTADPGAPPLIRMNLLADARDFERMVAGCRFGLSLLQDARLAKLHTDVFLPPALHANALNRPTVMNRLRSAAVERLFSLSRTAKRRVLKDFLLDPAQLIRDEEALGRLVLKAASPVHHVCGTCKMGPRNDADAVSGPNLRVHGVDGLRIADASVMPTIVSANTHMPVVMIAEKAAETILRG